MSKARVLTEEQKADARARAKAWYHANKERSLAANAEWRAVNGERHRANASAYYQANKEQATQQRAERRAANPDVHFTYHKEYRERNKVKISAYRSTHKAERLVVQNNRRARTFNGGKLPSDIVSVLMVKQRNRCANCKTDLRICGRHLDHRVALSKGGNNTVENVELLCSTCNLRKRNKDPLDWARQNGRLL
jgi:5-methylcytosine-specific restriction endonuclease McrA